jgi:two-component system C4-dicarboxylate transport response regulator DctD
MFRDNAPGVRVLIVEDEALIRWSLTQTLVDAGATVVEAADLRSAMAALRAADPGFDVAVLDVRLPDGSGLGLLATIRRLCPATRVLLMTAHGTPALLAEARALGAHGVVDKPFELHAMAGRILGAAPAG